MDTVIFVPDLIEYAFVGVYLSDAKFMGGEYSNESRNTFVLIKLLAFAPLFNAQKKHVLNYFELEMVAIVARRRHRREQRARGGERIFSTY